MCEWEDRVDKEPDDTVSNVMGSLGEAEVAALALLALGSLDDSESDDTDRSVTHLPVQRMRRRYEIHPVLALCIAIAWLLFVLGFFWSWD